MFKKIAAAAVVAVVATSGAHAQTALVSGQYSGTTEFTAITDPSGLCAAFHLVSVGEIQTSIGTFGLGRNPVVSTATPDTVGTTSGTPPVTTYAGVAQQKCIYAKLPLALDASGTTTINGITNCSSTNALLPPVRIVTGTAVLGITGTATINSLAFNTFKLTTKNAALEAYFPPAAGSPPAWTPLCFIGTDALFVRTGR